MAMQQRKKRDSNMELLRLVAMLLVMAVHLNYACLGFVTQQEIIDAPASAFVRAYIEQLCRISVNLFILISGWFGIHASLKGACNILFQVLLYSILFYIVGAICGQTIAVKSVLLSLWFGSDHWFIPSYLILYAVSPVLNTFVENVSQKQFRNFLLVYFTLEMVYGFAVDVGRFIQGNSAWAFLGLYLLSRYIKLYGVHIKEWRKMTYVLIYLLCSLIPTLLYLFTEKHYGVEFHTIDYNNPFIICASLAFMLFFTRLEFQSKLINWAAASSLALYLIHTHGAVLPHLKNICGGIYTDIGLWYFAVLPLICVAIGVVCILIDQLRIIVWQKGASLIWREEPSINR